MTKVSRLMLLDRLVGAPSLPMSLVHIERGQYYTAQTQNPALADGASLAMLIVTGPDGGILYKMVVDGSIGGDAEVTLYEDTVVTSATTPIPMMSRNRTRDEPSLSEAFTGLSVSDLGLPILGPTFIPGGIGRRQSPGGSPDVGDNFILKPLTNYMIVLTNKSGVDQPADILVDMIEQLDISNL